GHLSSIVKIGCCIQSHAPDFASVGQDFYSRLREQLPRNGSCCHESGRHPAREPSASPVVAETSVLYLGRIIGVSGPNNVFQLLVVRGFRVSVSDIQSDWSAGSVVLKNT